MTDKKKFTPDDATTIAQGLGQIAVSAADTFGGFSMIGGVTKFNIDFVTTGIAMGKMPLELMKILSECHKTIVDVLDAEIARVEKDTN